MTDKEFFDEALDFIVEREQDNDYICDMLNDISEETDICAERCNGNKSDKKTYRQHRIFGVLTSRQQLGRGDYRGEGGDKKTYSHILLSRMPKNNIKCAIIKYKQLNINIL